MNEPILCTGNELATVCADLRQRGFVPWALDVLSNANYRVSYFDGGKTITPKTPSGSEDSAQTNGGEARRTNPQDRTAVIQTDRPGCVESADLGSRDDLSIEDRIVALQEQARASGKLRRNKPRTVRMPYCDS